MHDDISIPSPTYRVPRRRGMDPATRRLALVAASIAGALVLIVGVWSMLGGRPQGIPVVQAPPGPVRVKPANPGGMQVAGVGNDIFSGGGHATVDELAPPPEVPDPQALRPPPPPPASTAVVPAASPAAAVPAVSPTGTVPGTSPTAAVPAASPPARPHAVVIPPPPPPAPQAVTPNRRVVAATPVGHGSTMVQLAALSTEAGARLEWRDLSRRLPGLLDHRRPVFSRVDDHGHVFWRVRTGGFAGQAEARRFCDQVRGRGLACTIADF